MLEINKNGFRHHLLWYLSITAFSLWFPMILPLVSSKSKFPGHDTSFALAYALVIMSGLSCTLLLDRFLSHEKAQKCRLPACAALFILSLLFLFADLPVFLNLPLIFLSSLFLSIQVLPTLKRIYNVQGAVFALCFLFMASGLFLSISSLVFPNFHSHKLLYTLLLGSLLTIGLLSSRTAEISASEEDIHLHAPQTMFHRADISKGVLTRAACLCAPVACLLIAILTSRLYISHRESLASSYGVTAPLVLFAATGFVRFFLKPKHLWLLGFMILTGLSIGTLTLIFPVCADYGYYIFLFFLFVSFCGAGILSILYLDHVLTPINRTFTFGFGLLYLFLLAVLLCRPNLLVLSTQQLNFASGNLWLFVILFPLMSFLVRPIYGPSSTELATHKEVSSILTEAEPSIEDVPQGSKTEIDTEPATTVLESTEETAEPSQNTLYAQLTMTEKKVYELILSGYSNQQMADMMYVSINTIKFHVKNILGKAGVSRKSQLVSCFIHNINMTPRTQNDFLSDVE